MTAQAETVRAVVFDFDYTLADSSPGIVDCTNRSLERLGLAPATPEAVCATIGLSLEEMFVALAPGAPADSVPGFRRHFLDRADRTMVDATVLYDDAGPTLTELARRGVPTAICTTKFRRRVVGVLSRAGLEGRVAAIVGSDEVRRPKPHPEAVRLALDRLGVGAEEALFVGDSAVDGEAARRAGVRFVAVTRGPTSRDDLRRWEPVAVLRGVGELPAWLDGRGEER